MFKAFPGFRGLKIRSDILFGSILGLLPPLKRWLLAELTLKAFPGQVSPHFHPFLCQFGHFRISMREGSQNIDIYFYFVDIQKVVNVCMRSSSPLVIRTSFIFQFPSNWQYQ